MVFSEDQGQGQWCGCEDVAGAYPLPKSPDATPSATLQAGPGVGSAAPHTETQAPSQPACSLPTARRPHGWRAPAASCARPACGWGIHGGPCHLPPMRTISSKGLCSHWCPDSQHTLMSTAVHHPYAACTLESRLLFSQQLQASSAPAMPASLAAV